MQSLQALRGLKPLWYPDQAIHAEYACRAFGLTFEEIDRGTGLAFVISSQESHVAFGAGRGSFFPQNNATATTLANDKYLSSVIFAHAGVAALGGQYFFLHERHRAHRPPGHERTDAAAYLEGLGGAAFCKPLAGSRGDFAQAIVGTTALLQYLDEVARYHDAILMQRVVCGREYRVFLLDDEVVYCARKAPPFVTGDGKHSLHALLVQREKHLSDRGISSASTELEPSNDLALILPAGQRYEIIGRMNRSAGGTMTLAAPDDPTSAFALTRRAAQVLGLRVAAVDIFTDIDGDAANMRIIEANANPSIRFLEDCQRDDLILTIWRHTFVSMGLLNV